jgi:hypothetical protein
MKTVNTWNEIKENIGTLESYLKSKGPENRYFVELIKRGTCFVAYQYEKDVHFAPSRFIGYSKNDYTRHLGNNSKDGRITNKAIRDILGCAPQVNGELEFRYKNFCIGLGFTPFRTGTYGAARKFWFSPKSTELMEQISNSSTNDKELVEDLKEISNQKDFEDTEKERLVSARIGQGWFREQLISSWNKCAVTGCDEITILRASHIKPWRYSDNVERLDVSNGILLTPNLDVLFDKGFISFEDNGKILLSKRIKPDNLQKVGAKLDMRINIKKLNITYLRWHRKNIFKK